MSVKFLDTEKCEVLKLFEGYDSMIEEFAENANVTEEYKNTHADQLRGIVRSARSKLTSATTSEEIEEISQTLAHSIPEYILKFM